MKKVLWIEDNTDLYAPYCMEAEDYDIELHPFECWADAKEALINDYDEWCAVILDAKCKLRKDDIDKADSFLPQVFSKLGAIYKDHSRTIPWYVLSMGGGEIKNIDDLIIEERLEWDADWHKKYYSKASDRKDLFERIKNAPNLSEAIQIRTLYFNDVFSSLKEIIKTDHFKEVQASFTDILAALHFAHKDFKPVLYYNQLRQILEYIFRACREKGIIPDVCFPDNKVNINQCAAFLSGKNATKCGVRYGNSHERIVPESIECAMWNILNIGNIQSHSQDSATSDEVVEENLKHTGNSRYVIFALAMHLCDIITWFAKYIREHDDIDMNRAKITILPKVGDEITILTDGKRNFAQYCKIDKKCSCVAGKKYKIKSITPNIPMRDDDIFPFFIKELEEV